MNKKNKTTLKESFVVGAKILVATLIAGVVVYGIIALFAFEIESYWRVLPIAYLIVIVLSGFIARNLWKWK